jgi:hypothetical protein
MMLRTITTGLVLLVGIVSCTVVEDEDIRVRDVPCKSDILYIGDVGNPNISTDDFIAQFDADTGEFLGYLVGPGDTFLNGPMGILVDKNQHVLLANQNFGEANSGEVWELLPNGKAPPKLLIAPTSEQGPPNAPWAPRGMVLGEHNVLYVVDLGYAANTGRVTLWNSKTGAYLGDLDFGDYAGWKAPRGIVVGPDGYIYVSNTNLNVDTGAGSLGGSILRFDPATGEFVNVVYECVVPPNTEPTCDLHRPEGLVFGPDGRLYVTSFRASTSDVDRILIFEIEDGEGTLVDTIELYQPGETRAYSQVILFGPDGALYVPITPSVGDTCSVRKYELIDGEWEWECFVDTDSPLVTPYYLSFGETNPSTLAYEPKKQCD